MRHALITLALLSAFQFVGAQEKDNRTPLEAYQGSTYYHQIMCEATLSLALARGDLYRPQDNSSDVQGCISKGKTEAKTSFNKALRTVRKPAAKEALKNYHVAFVTALEGLLPGTQEPKFVYEQRQQTLKSRLAETWAKFELEN